MAAAAGKQAEEEGGRRRRPLVVVMGATGTGKTQIAVELCKRFGGEAISADSMQVYQGLDIATAKVTAEEAQGVRHHLISYVEPHRTDYTVMQFRDDALRCMEDIWSRDKLPVLVGGTAYYIEAVLYDILLTLPGSSGRRDEDAQSLSQWYAQGVPPDLLQYSNGDLHGHLATVDAQSAGTIHPNNRKRVLRALQVYYTLGVPKADLVDEQLRRDGASTKGGPLRFDDSLLLWLQCATGRSTLKERLKDRVHEMVERGLKRELTDFYDTHYPAHMAEIDRLVQKGVPREHLQSEMAKGIWQSIGLKEFDAYLKVSADERESSVGEELFKAGVQRLAISTGKYATTQERRIRNRLLRVPGRQLPAMYQLDVSNTDVFAESMQTAVALAASYVAGTPAPCAASQLLVEPDAAGCERSRRRLGEHEDRMIRCLHCDTVLHSEYQWRAHTAGRQHRYMRGLASKNDAPHWDERNIDGRSDTIVGAI